MEVTLINLDQLRSTFESHSVRTICASSKTQKKKHWMTRSLSSQRSLFNVGSGSRGDAPETCVFSGQVNGPFLAELNDEVLLQIMSPGEFGEKNGETKVFLHQKRCLIGMRC